MTQPLPLPDPYTTTLEAVMALRDARLVAESTTPEHFATWVHGAELVSASLSPELVRQACAAAYTCLCGCPGV